VFPGATSARVGSAARNNSKSGHRRRATGRIALAGSERNRSAATAAFAAATFGGGIGGACRVASRASPANRNLALVAARGEVGVAPTERAARNLAAVARAPMTIAAPQPLRLQVRGWDRLICARDSRSGELSRRDGLSARATLVNKPAAARGRKYPKVTL